MPSWPSSTFTAGLLAPFALWPAFPASDYYEASAPPGAISRRRTCPFSRWPREVRATPDGSHVHLVIDRRVRRPALPLRHRHGYAADIHHGLPAACHIPAGSSPDRHNDGTGTHRSQPISARFELVVR